MLLLLSAIKLVAEIALMALLGQWLLGILAGTKRETNLVYRLFKVLTKPFVQGARWITPRVVLDRHLPLVAFLMLVFVWLVATLYRIQWCLGIGLEHCR